MTAAPQIIYDVPGEIEAPERTLLYNIARDHYTGRGAIVEVGALVGASTVCLAEGLMHNKVSKCRKAIRVFDRFLTYPHLADCFFPQHNIREHKAGDSFRAVYDQNTAPYADLIDAHEGDAHSLKWDGGPIEILFIDCAMSADLYQHFIDVLYPHLIDGAIVIDQDFFYERATWLPVKAEMMIDHCKPWLVAECTMAAKWTRPAKLLYGLPKIPLDLQLKLMERHAIRYTGRIAALIHIQTTVAMWNAGERDRARARLAEIQQWPLDSAGTYRAAMVLAMFA